MNASPKHSLRSRKKDLSGKTLYGKYRLVERIGGDNAFVLYEADDLIGKRKVAIAVLEPGVKVDPELKAAVHPNLAAVHEVIEKDGDAKFVVVDRPAGKSLEAVLAKRGKVEPALAVTAVMQILSALHSIHDRGRVHGSLDPGNVFFDRSVERQLQITLVDVTAVMDAGLPEDPRYMSPEQVIGEIAVDRRTDIWTVGVLLYEMLLGALPFDGDSRDEISGKILLEDPPVQANSIDVPEDLVAFLDKALSKDPADRHENVTAAQGDLLLVNEEFEELVAPAVAAALRESIRPPPPPAAAMRKPAMPSPREKLPPALALFGKAKATPQGARGADEANAPAEGPPPLPAKMPPPLPEQKPSDAAKTMPLMDGKAKKEPVEFEIAQPVQPPAGEADAPAEEPTTVTTPQDEDERTTAPAGSGAGVDGEEQERDSIEGRTTLPAPSGVFEELDSLAVAGEARRVAAEIDARAEDATGETAPAAKKKKVSPTLVAAVIAVAAVAGFVAVLFWAISGETEEAQTPVATPETPPQPKPPVEEHEPTPAKPKQPEPEIPKQPEPAGPEPQGPAQPDQPEPAEPESNGAPPAAGGDEAITLTLEGVPDGALIKINGTKATQPIRIPKSKKKVTLGIYLPGFHSHWERFTPTEDRVIEVEMPRKKGGAGAAGKEGDAQSWADNPWKK